MTRLLEFIVALILVLVLAVVVGVLLPTHGHVERTIEISHNMEHVADVLNTFHTFPDYSALRSLDPNVKFEASGPAFGVGSTTSWQGNDHVEHGTLKITQSEPGKIVWSVKNDWRGSNKHFTIELSRSDNQKLVKIRWSYDVDYSWNLIDRFSQLYLHGDPASFIQYSENNLQSMLASIPNVGYAQLDPRLVDTPSQPVLLVSTTAPRNLDLIEDATNKALDQIHVAMKTLGVKAVGGPVIFTTNWGDQNYSYDVAQVIDQSTLTIDGTSHDLTTLPQPMSNAAQNLAAASTAPAPSSSSDMPAPNSSSGMPAVPGSQSPGHVTDDGMLVIDANVNAVMVFGGRSLQADWPGDNPAGLPLMRLALKAYASTHGYAYNEYVNRFYHNIVTLPPDPDAQVPPFVVDLPVTDAPEQTPEQAAAPAAAQPATAGSTAPADDASVAAPASSS